MRFHYIILLAFTTLFRQQVCSQAISVDREQLVKTTKEALASKVTDKLTSSVTESIQKGEAWIVDKTYISIILEDFEVFGIDSKDPNFINQIYAIQKKINEKISKDPSLKSEDLLKGEISSMVKSGLINYASSYIDKGSSEIISSGVEMLTEGKKKIANLLKATEAIGDLDPYNPDYQSVVTSTLKKFGVKSDYFYAINDLDQVMSKGVKYVVGSVKAIGIISEAMGSEDPARKIELLITLGKEFGGYTPIIGDLITPIFQLAEGVFKAAKGLEKILDKNLGQGCITNDGGYGYVNPGKKKSFTSKFSNVGRICPLNQKIFSPIYNNIYSEESNEDQLFFYLNKKWFRGKFDSYHKGGADIKATIQWLRSNGYSDKVNDLNFVFNAYQKEYGWTAYKKQVSMRVEKMIRLFQSSYQTIGYCNENYLKDFYMSQIGFSWISGLMRPTDDDFEWRDLKYVEYGWEKMIINRMIFNYYLSRHKDNLNNLDRIINNLNKYVPVRIYGKITDEDGVPLQGAVLHANTAMFQVGDDCRKTITDSNGSFSFFRLFSINENGNSFLITSVSADSKKEDRIVISQDIRIEPSKSRSYLVNLISPASKDTASAYNTSTSGGSYSDEDIATMISNAPCADDPNAIAEWNDESQKVECSCIDNYVWDAAQGKCIQDIQAILANSDCSGYPNTEPKWDYENNEPYCDCIDGYVWDEDNYENGCISKLQQLLAQTDCSQYGNAHAVIDPETGEVTCDCLPGFVWNEKGTRCISENLIAMQNMDCSHIPNTEPAWDPVNKEPYCDCKPGYKWNDDYTACIEIVSQNPNDYNCPTPNTVPVWDNYSKRMVCDCKPGYMWNKSQTECIPIKRRPTVNWNNVLNMTMDVLNAVNNSNISGYPPGAGGNNSGNNQQPVVSQNNCNDKVEHGGDAPEVHIIDLGRSFGSFILTYNMYDIKDRIVVTQGGAVLYDSNCVSGSNSVRLNLRGFTREIQVRVDPNCAGTNGTGWDFTVHCPDQ